MKPLFKKALLIISALTAPTLAKAQTDCWRAVSIDCEAASLLQGTDSAPFLDDSRVREIAGLLKRIRSQFPELADIKAGPDLTRLEVYIADSVLPRLRPAPADTADGEDFRPVRTTRIADLDSLNGRLRATQVLAYYIGERLYAFHVIFPPWPNIPVLARAYDRVPQVEFASYPMYAGNGSFIRLIPKGSQDHIVFARGGGDCPAGCTQWDYYYLTCDRRSGRLRKEKQVLHSDPMQPRGPDVSLWDFPTRHSFMPYPTVDSLLAGTKSPIWWYRQHALDVLIYLLGPETEPWHGAGEQDRAKFTELQGELRAHHQQATRALVAALTDSDPDVRVLVREGLRSLYREDFGEGAAAQRHWDTWLAHQPY
jgi:hypothetical protein